MNRDTIVKEWVEYMKEESCSKLNSIDFTERIINKAKEDLKQKISIVKGHIDALNEGKADDRIDIDLQGEGIDHAEGFLSALEWKLCDNCKHATPLKPKGWAYCKRHDSTVMTDTTCTGWEAQNERL